jgi:hypothetical protein
MGHPAPPPSDIALLPSIPPHPDGSACSNSSAIQSAQIPSARRTQKACPFRQCSPPSRPAFLPRSPPGRQPAPLLLPTSGKCSAIRPTHTQPTPPLRPAPCTLHPSSPPRHGRHHPQIKRAHIMSTSAMLTSPLPGRRHTPRHHLPTPPHTPPAPIQSPTSNPRRGINRILTGNDPQSPRDTIASHFTRH